MIFSVALCHRSCFVERLYKKARFREGLLWGMRPVFCFHLPSRRRCGKTPLPLRGRAPGRAARYTGPSRSCRSRQAWRPPSPRRYGQAPPPRRLQAPSRPASRTGRTRCRRSRRASHPPSPRRCRSARPPATAPAPGRQVHRIRRWRCRRSRRVCHWLSVRKYEPVDIMKKHDTRAATIEAPFSRGTSKEEQRFSRGLVV